MVNDKYSDWLKKNGRKLMSAYSMAIANKYDVNSTEDVIKVLKIIDSSNANEKYAKEFSKMLVLFNKTIQKKLNLVKPKKQGVVN